MLLIFLLIKYALVVIFSTAGFTKLLDLSGTREAIKGFGAPKELVSPVSLLLPVLEITIAVGLIFSSTTWYASIAAFLLLALFVTVIAINIVRGQTPDCHCFGQLYSRPAGWTTLARNFAIAIAAGFVIWQARVIKVPISQSVLAISGLLLLIVLFCLIVYLQKRANRRELATPSLTKGLSVGSKAPSFELPHYDGGTSSLSRLLNSGKPVFLIFTSPLCGPCVNLFKEIGEWQLAHSDEITVAIVSRGTIKENFVNTVRNGLQNVLLQSEYEVAELYHSKVTPSALIINSEGTVGSQLAAGADEIRILLGNALGTEAAQNSVDQSTGLSRNLLTSTSQEAL